MFGGFWKKFYITADNSDGMAKLKQVKDGVYEVNKLSDEQRLNLLVLRRTASEIFSAIMRNQQGTWVGTVASLVQSGISAKISYSLLQAQAAGAMAAGNVPAAVSLQALAMYQLNLSTQAMAAQIVAQQQQQQSTAYNQRVNEFRDMYS